MGMIAIEIDGVIDVHIAGGVSDYATACGLALDGDRDSGTEVPTRRGTKITCAACRALWDVCQHVQMPNFKITPKISKEQSS